MSIRTFLPALYLREGDMGLSGREEGKAVLLIGT
jgi:hypothetical protein